MLLKIILSSGDPFSSFDRPGFFLGRPLLFVEIRPVQGAL